MSWPSSFVVLRSLKSQQRKKRIISTRILIQTRRRCDHAIPLAHCAQGEFLFEANGHVFLGYRTSCLWRVVPKVYSSHPKTFGRWSHSSMIITIDIVCHPCIWSDRARWDEFASFCMRKHNKDDEHPNDKCDEFLKYHIRHPTPWAFFVQELRKC